MPQAKSKSPSPPKNASPPTVVAAEPADVLTLVEAAAYLRIAPEEVLRLVREQGLPGRKVGADCRFLKVAIQDWLRAPNSERGRLLSLLQPFDAAIMKRFPVSSSVNDVQNDTPECVQEVPEFTSAQAALF